MKMPKKNKIVRNVVDGEETNGVDVASAKGAYDRRLGTGAIIGISAAGVALLAGVFGGGIALGATATGHGPAGISHEMTEAGGPMPGGKMRGGEMLGGPGKDQSHGPRQNSGVNGPMNGHDVEQRQANGMNTGPERAPGSESSDAPTVAPPPAG
ncbi:MAG: hypothetical protein ACJAS7_000519 [Alpinimonas sp.]|jgi:hypothetical protein